MKLLIIESPNKISQLSKILGRGWNIVPTYGHLENLPDGAGLSGKWLTLEADGRLEEVSAAQRACTRFGVDVANGFKPFYTVSPGQEKTILNIRVAAQQAEAVYIATDPDREGEAIAWSVAKLIPAGVRSSRIAFHSITRSDVMEAVLNPVELDMRLVEAAKARRVIDRLVGFVLSPLAAAALSSASGTYLGAKRGKNYSDDRFSVGRTQSAALELIKLRTAEVEAFRPQINYSLQTTYDLFGSAGAASYWLKAKSLNPFTNQSIAQLASDMAKKTVHTVKIIVKSVKTILPPPPFRTATMLVAANKKAGMSLSATSAGAQKLFQQGLITYPRTDSCIVSDQAGRAAGYYIEDNYGAGFHVERDYRDASGEFTQEAHECIRPTDLNSDIHEIDEPLRELYGIIKDSFIASQMKPAQIENIELDIDAGIGEDLAVKSRKVKDEGFLKALGIPRSLAETNWIPESLREGMVLRQMEVTLRQGQDRIPPSKRLFDEADLVTELDRHGIGRPGTYDGIMSRLSEMKYIDRKTGNKIAVSDKGRKLVNYLEEKHSWVVDKYFTKEMEDTLDEITRGKKNYEEAVSKVWDKLTGTVPELAAIQTGTGRSL